MWFLPGVKNLFSRGLCCRGRRRPIGSSIAHMLSLAEVKGKLAAIYILPSPIGPRLADGWEIPAHLPAAGFLILLQWSRPSDGPAFRPLPKDRHTSQGTSSRARCQPWTLVFCSLSAI